MANGPLDLLRVLKTLVETTGASLQPIQHVLLQDCDLELPGAMQAQLQALPFVAVKGFFHCAAHDVMFCDLARVSQFYGRTIEQAYPDTSRTFMKVARTYWTFKVIFNERDTEDNSVCTSVLAAADLSFAGVFFPTAGPFGPPREQRMEAMRAMIVGSGAALDAEDFLRGNPYV